MKRIKFIFTLLTLVSFTSNAQTQLGQLLFGENNNDNYGFATSINANGSIVAIGAPNFDDDNNGLVRVFEFDEGTDSWIQLGGDIIGEEEFDLAGSSISVNDEGNILAIGGSLNNGNGTDSGHTRVFEFQSNDWVQLGDDIDGENEGDSSGSSVSLNASGSRVAIGANRNSDAGNNAGHVRIFEFNTATNMWVQIGNDIDGDTLNEQTGREVSLNDDGTVVAVGASQNAENGSFSGQVRVYVYSTSSDTWEQLGQDLNGEDANDNSGDAISINGDGDIVAIGAIGNEGNGSFAGHVRVYQYNEGTSVWEQLGVDINGAEDGSAFGNSVSLTTEGTKIAIGAPGDVFASPGSVFVFEFNISSQTWVQLGETIAPNPAGRFGRSVAMDATGDTIVIGATSAGSVNEGAASILDISELLTVADLNTTDTSVYVFPNPFFADLNIVSDSESIQKMTIYTTLGQKVMSISLNQKQEQLSLDQLETGTYILEMFVKNKRIIRKIIKK